MLSLPTVSASAPCVSVCVSVLESILYKCECGVYVSIMRSTTRISAFIKKQKKKQKMHSLSLDGHPEPEFYALTCILIEMWKIYWEVECRGSQASVILSLLLLLFGCDFVLFRFEWVSESVCVCLLFLFQISLKTRWVIMTNF